MEKFRVEKTPKEVENNIRIAEWTLGKEVVGSNERSKILKMSEAELKSVYPDQYEEYLQALRTGAIELRKKFGRTYLLSEYEELCNLIAVDSTQAKREDFLPPTRRRAMKITTPNGSHIVKSLESSAEKEISRQAGALGIGPKQLAVTDEDVLEEFVEGVPLLKLGRDRCTPDFMKDLGIQFVRALKTLHEHNILVNDQILSDDFGKSHTIIDTEGRVRFIDLGASISLEHYPNITNEEVLSLMRTDPFMAFKAREAASGVPEVLAKMIQWYRENILSRYPTKADIIAAKDFQLLNEGVMFLSQRLPNVQSFVEGVREVLEEK